MADSDPGVIESKRRWFQDFLVDKRPLISRLEYLVQLVLDPVRTQQLLSTKRALPVVPVSGPATRAGKRRQPDSAVEEPEAKRTKLDDNPPKQITRAVPRDENGRPILPIRFVA